MKKELAKKDKMDISILTEIPEWIKEAEGDNSGNEDVGKDDIIIPRLSIVQAISPELDKSDPAYIEGAADGLMFNTLTKELMDEILVISIKFEKPYLLWRNRKKGGGFGGQYSTPEEADEARSKQEHPADWGIDDTPTNLCLAINKKTGKMYEIAIPMPRSKAKVAREWNTKIRLAGGPRYSSIWKITTFQDKNTAGEKFKNFKLTHFGYPSKAMYEAAKELYEMVSSGQVKYETDYSGAESNDGGENTPF